MRPIFTNTRNNNLDNGVKISIDQVIGSNYIRYDALTNMVNTAFAGSNANKVYLYIDLYTILKPLYKNNSYNIEDYSKVTSNIINICAHYRDFFKTRYRVQTEIFLVYSKNIPYVNKQFYPDYNGRTEALYNTNPLIEDMIKYNIELLEILCPYLPDIHFVKSTFETGVVIYDLMCRNELREDCPHIVLTKDMYLYQLVAARDNITIFRPKKQNQMDVSYFINKSNLIKTYLADRKANSVEQDCACMMPECINLLMILSSTQERGIKSLLNIKTVSRVILESINQFKLLNGYNSITSIWDNIDNSRVKLSRVSFESRAKSIDIIFQHSIFINTQECKDIRCVNLYDPENIKEINNKYFSNNPLDLDRL